MKGDTEETNSKKRKVIRLNYQCQIVDSVHMTACYHYYQVFQQESQDNFQSEESQRAHRRGYRRRGWVDYNVHNTRHLGHRGIQNNSTVLVNYCFVFCSLSSIVVLCSHRLLKFYFVRITLIWIISCHSVYSPTDRLARGFPVIYRSLYLGRLEVYKICHVEKNW